MDSDLVYQKWKLDYKKLRKEIDLCMSQYSVTKKCDCPIEDCKHFEKARDRVFGKKIDDIFNSCLKNSFQAFAEINGSVRRN